MRLEDNLKIARELLAALPAECAVSKAYMYGSRARGDADPTSDLDILIVLKGEATRSKTNMVLDIAWELSLEHGLLVSPIIVSEGRMEHGPLVASSLARNIHREGIEVAA